jgi:hypothetical protein
MVRRIMIVPDGAAGARDPVAVPDDGTWKEY